MTRPFSDSVTMEMPEMLETVPLVLVKNTCAWCEIRLSVIPDSPRPVFAPDGVTIWYTHPGGCTTAYRAAVA